MAAIMGLLAVALGAFGAHGLKETLARIPDGRTIWEQAVFYHFIHAVMLFVLAMRKPLKRFSWFAFLMGIILFSGSLYIYAVSGPHWMVYLTPIGGVSFIAGWVCLVISPPTETN
jgi:uncharacterized membrane protein YgdD (TMEM256/DUF423 family)